jgi:putative transposase
MLVPGSPVVYDGRRFKLVEIHDLKTVVIADESGATHTIPAAQLLVPKPDRGRVGDLAALDPAQVRQAWEGMKAMRVLSETPNSKRSTADVDKVAQMLERSRSTVYRWLDRYETQASLSALMRKRRNDVGRSRLPEEIEAVISHQIETHYLTLNRRSIASTAEEVRKECKSKGLREPDESTVRDRIHRLDPRLVEERRYGDKRAAEKFDPLRGSFPNADYPLSVVQMDHTPVDVIIVDDTWRKPIGRPYLTLAIDVRTKMVVGFYISLDHPGALSTGLCMLQAILPKEQFLAELNLSHMHWPCWGKMRTIHTDNAKEFRGTMLGWAAKEHGIIAERRPRGQPRYGGHVERSFRTFMAKVHELPGTTFSSVHDKVDYDSEGKAVMTLHGLVKWFTLYLLGYYHQKPHKGNNEIPPIKVWQDLLLVGTPDQPPMGLPAPVDDPEQLRLDFLPYFERTIQEYGIQNWGLTWYSDALRRFIHAKDKDKPNAKKKFICRYDPRDLSRLWVYDDQHRTYIEVPFADLTRPPVSLWEVKEAKRMARAESRTATNEELIFRTIDEMRKVVSEEAEATKKARRQQQRQKGWESARKAKPASAPAPASPPPAAPDEDDVLPFDSIRES